MSTPKHPSLLLAKRAALCASVALALAAPAALAQLTDLANEPLAQPATNIKPNVVMILDDSGSMREQYTPDYLGRLFGSAEELCFDSKDTGGTVTSTLEDCEVGDPPMMAPEVNFQYYNPQIRYLPAVNYDGSSRGNMDAVATSNWSKVPTDNVTTAGNNTFRVNILAMNGGGTSETFTDLTRKWPDRAWCDLASTDHNNAANYPPTAVNKCRLNSQYSYPNQNFGYGRDGSGNIKYVYGAPYYYQIVPTEFCTDATLTNCQATQTTTYSVPAPVRFCSDVNLTNCQGKLTGSFVRPKFTGIYVGGAAIGQKAKATITVKNPQSDSNAGTISSILINGVNVIGAPLSFGPSFSPNAVASAIAGAIGAGYTASAANNVVTIFSATESSIYNGYVVNVVSPGTPVQRASVTFDIIDADRDTDKVTSIRIGSTEVLGTTITCSWSTGCTQNSQNARDNWMGSAIASAINAGTPLHGYSATTASAGSQVTIWAPSGTGGELNGQPLTVTKQGIVDITGKSLSGGASSGDVETVATNMSGGQDSAEGRNNVGQFVRVNIVPFVGVGESESYQPSVALLDKDEVKAGESAGQTFRHDSTGATYSVDKLALVMSRDSGATPGQTLTVTLRSSWNSAPIATATILSDNLGTGAGWVTFNLGAAVTLNDLQTYVIRVDSDGDGKVYLGRHDPGIYAGGDLLKKDGSTDSGKDLAFQVVGGVPATYTRYPARTDCAASTCSYAEEMTNFANWYAYYRSRMQMAKTAIGRAFRSIDESYRVGFITINPGNPVNSDRFQVVDNFDAAQRQAWYKRLYDQEDHGSTPLREALSRVGRYFAGVTGGINSGMGASPIQVSCQPNYAILTTDGYWNGNAGQSLTGGAIGNQDNSDSGYSTRAVGAYDGGLAGAKDTLADVAMYYYKNDLRTDLADFSPTTQNDTAPHQHMVTFTVGLGLAGLLNFDPNYQSATTGDFVAIKQGTKDWPVPAADSESALDDLWHAAVNSRGTFFSTRDPVQLTNGIVEALSAVQKRVGAGAAAATSNLQPVAGDNFAFTAQYQTVAWTGDLKARTIDLSTGIVASRELWSAAVLLDQRSHTNRKIYTFDAADATPGPGNGNLLKAFCWQGAGGTGFYPGCAGEGELTPAELAAWFDPTTLLQYGGWTTDGSGRDAAVSAQKLVDFLRGDQGNETTGGAAPTDLFRNRESLLGDIVNAQPAYVKGSPFSYNTGSFLGRDPFYQEYRQTTDGTVSTRKGTAFAAANDGMLHAFETDPDNNPYYQTAGISTTVTSDDAFTGTLNTSPDVGEGSERWAYIPSMVAPGLKALAETPLLFVHKYYTDGTPVAGDVCFGHSTSTPCASQTSWHTIMVAGLNAGGRGYYAIDITDPDNPKGLWEFKGGAGTACLTDAQASSGTFKEDCNLGYTFGTPVIAKRKSDGKWVVFVTSGHNNVNPGNGKGYLYVLEAQTGLILQRIGTGVGCDGISSTAPCTASGTPDPSGLNKLNAWVENASFDNTVETVYAGDLKGNLWRFQLDPAEAGYNTAYKLVTLVDSSGNPQPITTKPELGEVSNFRVVFVGTGKLLGTSDLSDTQQQTIWGIRDDLTSNTIDLRGGDLIQQTLSTLGPTTRTATANPVDFNTKKGWFVDLPDSGERVNVDPVLQLGTLVIPSNVPTTDACVAGGFGWINFLDFRTGGYIPGSSLNTASNRIAASLVVGINVVQLPGGAVKTIVTTADNQQLTQETPVAPPAIVGKRVSWRELIVQ